MTPVHYFWVGPSVSSVEQLVFAACKKNGHTPVVWCYEDIQNLPSFVEQRPAGVHLPEAQFHHLLHDLRLPLANISDVFRYNLLLATGGYYSDTDVVLVKNLDSIPDDEFFCSTHEYEWGECANGCFMKLRAGSDTTQYLTAECSKRIDVIEKDGIDNANYCYLGPFLVQQCVKDLGVKVLPWDYFNPISWRWVKELIAFHNPDYKFLAKTFVRTRLHRFENRGYGATQNTYAIHLCNEMWKQNQLDKNARFHRLALYERLRRKYA